MGKRLGVTKSGRVMNPADRERKQMRMKELKRNKKERVKIRHAIVKSRDPAELIEHMEKLDDQEFDMANELALNVIVDKRSKYKGAFIQMIALYRVEKEEKKVKELEMMLQDYELGRSKKEQHHKAELFSTNANPDEIPLPMGMMAPNAALTPFVPPPVPPQFHATMKAGILKKSAQTSTKKHKYPPGPPCGLPPNLSDDEDNKREEKIDYSRERLRRVHFNERERDADDDYGPVDIPETMLSEEEKKMLPPNQPVYSRGASGRALPPPGHNTLIPPGMMPLPPRLLPGYHLPPSGNDLSGYPLGNLPMRNNLPLLPGSIPPQMFASQKQLHQRKADDMNASAIISAAPQVNKPSPATGTVISAAPQMRNMKKETTRFVPTALRVSRPTPLVVKPKPMVGGPNFFPHKPNYHNKNSQPAKSADEACDEFLREIEDLL